VKPHKLPWNESVNFLHSDYKELGLFCFLQMAGHKDDFPRIKVTGSDHNGSTFAGQASKLWPKTLTYTLRQLAPLRFFFSSFSPEKSFSCQIFCHFKGRQLSTATTTGTTAYRHLKKYLHSLI